MAALAKKPLDMAKNAREMAIGFFVDREVKEVDVGQFFSLVLSGTEGQPLCLDVGGGNVRRGAGVIVWDQNGAKNQLWK